MLLSPFAFRIQHFFDALFVCVTNVLTCLVFRKIARAPSAGAGDAPGGILSTRVDFDQTVAHCRELAKQGTPNPCPEYGSQAGVAADDGERRAFSVLLMSERQV